MDISCQSYTHNQQNLVDFLSQEQNQGQANQKKKQNNSLQQSAYNINIQSQINQQNQYRAGDWVCLVCNNLNFSFRNTCNRCKVQTKKSNYVTSLLMLNTNSIVHDNTKAEKQEENLNNLQNQEQKQEQLKEKENDQNNSLLGLNLNNQNNKNVPEKNNQNQKNSIYSISLQQLDPNNMCISQNKNIKAKKFCPDTDFVQLQEQNESNENFQQNQADINIFESPDNNKNKIYKQENTNDNSVSTQDISGYKNFSLELNQQQQSKNQEVYDNDNMKNNNCNLISYNNTPNLLNSVDNLNKQGNCYFTKNDNNIDFLNGQNNQNQSNYDSQQPMADQLFDQFFGKQNKNKSQNKCNSFSIFKNIIEPQKQKEQEQKTQFQDIQLNKKQSEDQYNFLKNQDIWQTVPNTQFYNNQNMDEEEILNTNKYFCNIHNKNDNNFTKKQENNKNSVSKKIDFTEEKEFRDDYSDNSELFDEIQQQINNMQVENTF